MHKKKVLQKNETEIISYLLFQCIGPMWLNIMSTALEI